MRKLAVVAFIAAAASLAFAAPSQAQEMASMHGGGHHENGGGHHENHHHHDDGHHHHHVRGPLIYGNTYPYQFYAVPVGGYWYYCPSAQMYYPSVTNCIDAWIPVRAE